MTTRNQARIHTGFHRFAKIGQKSDQYPVWMTQKPKGKET